VPRDAIISGLVALSAGRETSACGNAGVGTDVRESDPRESDPRESRMRESDLRASAARGSGMRETGAFWGAAGAGTSERTAAGNLDVELGGADTAAGGLAAAGVA
jgi:hypothetical protein